MLHHPKELWNIIHNTKVAAYERLTVGDTAVSLDTNNVTHTTYGKCRAVTIGIEDNDIRMTRDGTDPDNTGGSEVGIILYAGTVYPISGETDVSNLKFIDKTAGSSAVLQVQYSYVDI